MSTSSARDNLSRTSVAKSLRAPLIFSPKSSNARGGGWLRLGWLLARLKHVEGAVRTRLRRLRALRLLKYIEGLCVSTVPLEHRRLAGGFEFGVSRF